MSNVLYKLTQHWFGLVMLLHVGLFILQFNVFFPLETLLFGKIASYASVLFIPHAVRVLAAWLLGPRVLFALVPAELLANWIYSSHQGQNEFAFFLIPILSASSAVIAFEFLRMIGQDVYPQGENLRSWRWVVLAGLVASIFNSISGTFLKVGDASWEMIGEVSMRFLIGDMSGLIVSLFCLMMIFKFARNSARNGLT